MRARTSLLLALVATVAVAGGALAGSAGPSTLTFRDALGDGATAQTDIAGVTFTTSGKGKGTRYTPTELVVTMSLARRPAFDARTIYSVRFTVPGCGLVELAYVPGSTVYDGSSNRAECGAEPDELGLTTSRRFAGDVELDQRDVIWRVPLQDVPFAATPGTRFESLFAYTNMVEPVFGALSPTRLAGQPRYDEAATPRSYTLG